MGEPEPQGAEQQPAREHPNHSPPLAAIATIATGAAHDINNLLTTILGHASLAYSEAPVDSPVRASLVQIRSAARQAASLTRQMLTLQARSQQRRHVPLDLNGLLGDLHSLLRIAIPRRITLLQDIPAETVLITGDEHSLQRVLMNLVLNATQAIRQEGAIHIELTQVKGQAHIRIRDDGCGMSAEVRDKIFEPGFTTRTEGHGYGLAELRSIIQAHRGDIHVSSAEGKGSLFAIELPISTEELPNTRPQEVDIEHWQAIGKALLVEPNHRVLDTTRRHLEGFGFTVSAHQSGREALRELRADSDSFSAVVLDLDQSDLSAQEVLRAIRRLTPDLAVLITCAGAQDTAQELDQLFNGLITKPFDRLALGHALRRIVD